MTRAPATLDADAVSLVRASHRREQAAGFFACLAGVLVMLAGRFMPGAPGWLAHVGLAVVVLGWGLLAFAVFGRLALARSLAKHMDG